MRGHVELITLRRQGSRPPMVWVRDGRYMPDAHWRYLRDCGELGDAIELDPEDHPARADLRWATDLVVNLSGTDEMRVGRFARALVDAGARHVIASWATTARRRDGDWDVLTHRMTFSNDELSQWPA